MHPKRGCRDLTSPVIVRAITLRSSDASPRRWGHRGVVSWWLTSLAFTLLDVIGPHTSEPTLCAFLSYGLHLVYVVCLIYTSLEVALYVAAMHAHAASKKAASSKEASAQSISCRGSELQSQVGDDASCASQVGLMQRPFSEQSRLLPRD